MKFVRSSTMEGPLRKLFICCLFSCLLEARSSKSVYHPAASAIQGLLRFPEVNKASYPALQLQLRILLYLHSMAAIMAQPHKKIVILGGSYGGLSVAHYTLKHIIPQAPNKEHFQVVLISTSSQAFCRPSCPRAMLSDDAFPQSKLFVDIQTQFQQYTDGDNFQFIKGKAVHLDQAQRVVTIQTDPDAPLQQVAFHALVIATGASTPSPLFGFVQDEKFLRECWISFRKALPGARNIVISGGGPTSIETAGELGEYLNGRPGLFRSGQPSPRANITVITSNSRILPALRESIANKAEKILAGVGVTVIKNARVKTVVPEIGTGSQLDLLTSKTTVVLEDGETIDADLYIPATGTTPNTSFIPDKSLLVADGRVNTNASTLRVDCAGPDCKIYAIGDASSYARPAVHNILSAVPILCASMKHDLLLEGNHHKDISAGGGRLFEEDTRETQLVPIGTAKGVGAAMGMQLPSFLVWLLKGRDYWLWTTGSLWNGKKWNKES
jgi:apoptosis-inducing factor 2